MVTESGTGGLRRLCERRSASGGAANDGLRGRGTLKARVSTGLFTYPVLMAADILALGGNLVPVGRDQAQHLEITRDIAAAFNRGYGPVFTVPEAAIDPTVETIAGTDGRKMSKSYDNVLALFAPADETRRRIRGIVTDSRWPKEPKDPNTCRLFTLYRYLAPADRIEDLDRRYRAGGVGYGEVKDELAALFEDRFGPARERFTQLRNDHNHLNAVLADGAARARHQDAVVLDAVRRARGVAA